MNENIKYFTISELNEGIKEIFDRRPGLQNIHLKGEISNYKRHSRGHLYFTLKDENSNLKCLMFASNTNSLKFEPKDGDKVLVSGKISVYVQDGTYQLYCNTMELDGIGNLFLEFEKLKKKLFEEGLFNPEHKKPIPKFPKRIGIITAPTGAAIKDIISTINRRYPICETILFPSLVQGEFAKDDIVKNIKLANTYDLDVIILGRGGGSIEDLWPFNEEIVARAIYDSKIPIISGVGHEPDFTISDFVSDRRAPTPTGAAEMCVPNISDVIKYLDQINIRLIKSMNVKIDNCSKDLERLKNSFVLKNPMSLYESLEQRFDNLYERLIKSINLNIDNSRNRYSLIKQSYVFTNPNILFKEKIYNYNDLINKIKLNINKIIETKTNNYVNILGKLEVLNPISTLKRGYSRTTINNKTINSIKNIKTNDKIITEVSDGKIESVVTSIL